MPARIVVVDDDEALRNAVHRALRLEGYDVELAGDGAEGLARLAGPGADPVVLDVLMPGLDGISVCRRLRDSGDRTPVLMLTACDAVSDRVLGLDAGADDYLTKPFALEELLARVRALLRRRAPEQEGALRVADLELNPRTRQVTRGDCALELTRTEFALLELLMCNAGMVLTRGTLKAGPWKWLQRLNYFLFALVVAHALYYAAFGGALLRATSPSTLLLGPSVVAVFAGQAVGVRLWQRRHSRAAARPA